MKNFTQKFIGIFALVFAMSFTASAQTYPTFLESTLDIAGFWTVDSIDLTVTVPISQEYLDYLMEMVDQGFISAEDFLENFGFEMPTTPEEWDAIATNGVTMSVPTDSFTVSGFLFTENQMGISTLDSIIFNNYLIADNIVYTDSIVDLPFTEFTIVSVTSDNLIMSSSGRFAIGDDEYNSNIIFYCSAEEFTLGCMSSWADNYNSLATSDDGSCYREGCMSDWADNYDSLATTDNGSCVAVVNGCMDSSMSNYNSEANTDDGSCVSWEEVVNNLQAQLDNVVPEDGVSQEDVDAAYEAGAASVDITSDNDEVAAVAFADGVASVDLPECEEVATQNIPLYLPQGWSMFGYTCLESLDVVEAFSDISDNIEIVKDEWGLAYLPAWGFSAFDNLEFGEGYQIKMIEEVTDFQFCTTATVR